MMKTLIALLVVLTFGGFARAEGPDAILTDAHDAMSTQHNFGRDVSQSGLLSLAGKQRIEDLWKECGSSLSLTAKTQAGALVLMDLQKRAELELAQQEYARAQHAVVVSGMTGALGGSFGMPVAPDQKDVDAATAARYKVIDVKASLQQLEAVLRGRGLLTEDGSFRVQEKQDYDMHLYGRA